MFANRIKRLIAYILIAFQVFNPVVVLSALAEVGDSNLVLYTDESHTNEGYQFNLGDTVFGQAIGLNTNHGYKFDVLNLDGSVIPGTETSCITGDEIPGNNYATTDVSDDRNFTYELHEWDTSDCSGDESQGSPITKEFSVTDSSGIEIDTTAPTSNIDYPIDGETYTQEYWNEDGEIRGTASDEESGVSTVYISIMRDSDGAYWCDFYACGDSYGWYFGDIGETLNETDFDGESWYYEEIDISDLLPQDGTEGYTIKSHAEDYAGNLEDTSEVHFHVQNIQNDITAPTAPEASPPEGDYTESQQVTLSSNDEGSGVNGIYYTLDAREPSNESGTLFGEPITVSESMTIKAIAYDDAGNASIVSTFTYGIAPVISEEASANPTSTSITVNWTTDHLSTSRVVYDTISHSVLGAAPNYGYANSTVETDTSPKVTLHSVALSGLSEGTTYYYRTISKGSPESVGSEKSFTTTKSPTTQSPTASTGSSGSGGNFSPASAPVCNETKPGSAPTLLSALPSENSVNLAWSPAQDPVSYYLVAYGLSSGVLQYGNPNAGGKDTLNYNVQGLSGGTTYYFRVRAGNNCAPGDYSNELSATPYGSFVSSTATGFTEGVLGAQDEDSDNAQSQPEPSQTMTLAQTLRNIFSSILGFIRALFAR